MGTTSVAIVGESLAQLAPASVQMGEGETTFAVNRRNTREKEVPDLLAKSEPLKGPVDHVVPVVRPNEKLEIVLLGHARHPKILSVLTWCGDYPGFV